MKRFCAEKEGIVFSLIFAFIGDNIHFIVCTEGRSKIDPEGERSPDRERRLETLAAALRAESSAS
jgi:hypothetical protein